MPDDVLRNFEKELDQHYRTFQIYGQPNDIGLYALLASYDSMFLPLAHVSSISKISSKTVLFFKTLRFFKLLY